MALIRETVYAALWARLAAVPGIVTASRRLRHVADVAPLEQPALFMAQGPQRAEYATGATTLWFLRGDIYLYAVAQDDGAPGPVINPLMDAVLAVFAPDNLMVNACTLGGVVRYAKIAGEIETDEGTMGAQALVRIPFELHQIA